MSVETDVTDFQKEVLDASRTTPVVVDFWAEWCGPCRILGPVLDKLEAESEGQWKLVKVDTDSHPDLAMQYNVKGIPSVKMFYQGEIIADFTGAQPEPRVRNWLAMNLPEAMGEQEDWQSQVNNSLADGELLNARKYMEQQYSPERSDTYKMQYALLLLPDDPQKARTLYNQVEEEAAWLDEREMIETVASLKQIIEGHREIDREQKGAEDYLNGINALFNHQFEDALTHFINVVAVNRELDEDGARKAVLAIFGILTEHHPLTDKFRRRFSMALY